MPMGRREDPGFHCVCCYTVFVCCLLAAAHTDGAAIEASHFDVICSNILKLDCSLFQDHDTSVNCGTDLTTYNNSCQFAQGHCLSPDLHVRHSGACVASGGAGMMAAHGMSVVLQLVCDDVIHLTCSGGAPGMRLCASDGQTYRNNCVFEKERCRQFGLRVLHAGPC